MELLHPLVGDIALSLMVLILLSKRHFFIFLIKSRCVNDQFSLVRYGFI